MRINLNKMKSGKQFILALPNDRVQNTNFPLFVAETTPAGNRAVHGQGLFTSSRNGIPKGSKIVKWEWGTDMTYDEFKSQYRVYPSAHDRKVVLDWRYVYRRRPFQLQTVNKEWNERNAINFCNDGVHCEHHSVGDPLCDCPGSNVHLAAGWLVASKDIDEFEELLLSYGPDYWLLENHSTN